MLLFQNIPIFYKERYDPLQMMFNVLLSNTCLIFTLSLGTFKA